MPEFVGFPKIPRYSRDCIISEKIDGTNGCIYIGIDEGSTPEFLVGSRTRWITPEKDNHGFAKWAYENKEELLKLGSGLHFGEFWGQGIQRSYGLKEKRFSLLNVIRWTEQYFNEFKIKAWETSKSKEPKPVFVAPPACCHVVPVIIQGFFCSELVMEALCRLQVQGSFAAPGFMNPEGIVIFHSAANFMFKKTLLHDEKPKGSTE